MKPEQKKRWPSFIVNRNFYLSIIVLITPLLFFLRSGGGFLFAFITIIVYILISLYLENRILK
jgi:hypothetical protein